MRSFYKVDTPCGLVLFLKQALNVSGKKVKAILDARVVFVNGQRIWMAKHPLEEGDEVEVCEVPSSPRQGSIKILHEDKEYLVVNKSVGILSSGLDSIEERLRKQEKCPAVNLVHRLDKDTSGCLLLAKEGDAKERMIPLFKKQQVSKQYLAISMGCIPHKIKKITKPIEGQIAITGIKVIDGNKQASLLSIDLHTGRTHQIRKHLASIGHPIAGDKHYATLKLVDPVLKKVPRQMLHAWQLSFKHPQTGISIHVTAPLPDDFRRCLKQMDLPNNFCKNNVLAVKTIQ
ncbi:MAG: RluA family pseudouridine synthase [Kiritimatiellae bacterium]|nr:RluA family pseudouridine synthase [Kiritimatiellia bacterium]